MSFMFDDRKTADKQRREKVYARSGEIADLLYAFDQSQISLERFVQGLRDMGLDLTSAFMKLVKDNVQVFSLNQVMAALTAHDTPNDAAGRAVSRERARSPTGGGRAYHPSETTVEAPKTPGRRHFGHEVERPKAAAVMRDVKRQPQPLNGGTKQANVCILLKDYSEDAIDVRRLIEQLEAIDAKPTPPQLNFLRKCEMDNVKSFSALKLAFNVVNNSETSPSTLKSFIFPQNDEIPGPDAVRPSRRPIHPQRVVDVYRQEDLPDEGMVRTRRSVDGKHTTTSVKSLITDEVAPPPVRTGRARSPVSEDRPAYQEEMPVGKRTYAAPAPTPEQTQRLSRKTQYANRDALGLHGQPAAGQAAPPLTHRRGRASSPPPERTRDAPAVNVPRRRAASPGPNMPSRNIIAHDYSAPAPSRATLPMSRSANILDHSACERPVSAQQLRNDRPQNKENDTYMTVSQQMYSVFHPEHEKVYGQSQKIDGPDAYNNHMRASWKAGLDGPFEYGNKEKVPLGASVGKFHTEPRGAIDYSRTNSHEPIFTPLTGGDGEEAEEEDYDENGRPRSKSRNSRRKMFQQQQEEVARTRPRTPSRRKMVFHN